MTRILFVNIAFMLGIQGIGYVDAGPRSDIPPRTKAIPAFMVAGPCRSKPEAAGSQTGPFDGDAELEAIGLRAEEDVLLT